MLGCQSRTKTLAYRPPILLPHQLQYLLPKFRFMSMVRGPTHTAMLQPCGALLPISPPQSLRLPVAHPQELAGIYNPQMLAPYTRQHFHPSQLLVAHLCPPQSDLLSEVVLGDISILDERGHYYRGATEMALASASCHATSRGLELGVALDEFFGAAAWEAYREKTRRLRGAKLLLIAEDAAIDSASERERFACARHADVDEAALFFDAFFFADGAAVRADAFLHAGEKNMIEFEALRAVKRDERDAGLVFEGVGVADERRSVEKIGEGFTRVHAFGDRASEFFEVFDASNVVGSVAVAERGHVA